MTQAHQGLQVVYQLNDQSYEINETALEQILLRDDVKDLPVVVVSVAGPFRAGKSFLLNFFLRYLTAPEEARNETGDWLGGETEPLTGFSWRGGSERNTTGIHMWSEPFISTLPSGDKVAVLLMDTQGTFDSSSTVRDCSTFFALSTLVSSVLIYNIKEDIKESDLQHLELFSEYGKLVKDGEGTKAFQMLQFLVRDWPYEFEHAYGLTGGAELLTKRLEVKADMAAELRDVRQNITSCFEKISCFLMPHPGLKVKRKDFTGKLCDMDPEFKTALKEFVPAICSPANLTPKLVKGEKVKARELVDYIKTYVRMYNSDKTPTPRTILKAASEAALAAAREEARTLYESRMERVTDADQPNLSQAAIRTEHINAVAAAQTAFNDRKIMAPKKDKDDCLAHLTEELESELSKYLLINTAKVAETIAEAQEAYKATIKSVHGATTLCLHPTDLKNAHGRAVAAALRVYDAKTKSDDLESDSDKSRLLQNLEKKYEELSAINNQHNRIFLTEAKLHFSLEIDGLMARDPPLPYYQFRYKYDQAVDNAIQRMLRNRNTHSSYSEDPYKDELEQDLRRRFDSLEKIYSSTRN